MNFLRHEFSKECEPQLLNFLRIAREHKSNCDLQEHEIWQKLLPLDPSLIHKLDEPSVTEQIPVVDLCSDEELVTANVSENRAEESEAHDRSGINDVAFAIKENLETQHDLSEIARESLANCLTDELEGLFPILEDDLTSEEVYHFGISLQNGFKNNVIIFFCRYLLLPRIKREYSDNLVTLLDQYSLKYPSILKEELLLQLYDIRDDNIKIFLQYINKLNQHYQATLLRDFIFGIETLDNNNLLIVENIINAQVEYETLNKLVEMLSNIAEGYSKDKAFGKLLVNTIQFLGPNLLHLEQPLKHIIAGHQSVWRSKLEKTFTTCYEDSSMFSQSFRD